MPPQVLCENIRTLADRQSLLQERRICELAEMAEAAARQNQERGDYVMAENPEEEPGETMDWAALIRCNAAEAVVISEILAKPPALR